jgi:hypothetical protein
MRRNPDLLAVIAIALYVWVGAVHPNAAPVPRPIVREGARIRQALRTELRNALREFSYTLRITH